jgi:hypothetical protein
LDTVLEEGGEEGVGLEQEVQMNAMAQLQNGMAAANPQNQIMMPSDGALPDSEMSGGMMPPNMSNVVTPGEGLVTGPQIPGGGPIIAVRTDSEAMMADGLLMGSGFGMSRQPRRNPYRSFGGMGMGPMMPSVSRYTPMEGGNAMPSSITPGGQITINKME